MVIFSTFSILSDYVSQQKTLQQAKAAIVETKSESKSGVKRMRRLQFEDGETVGVLRIPRLEEDLPIIEGTSPEELKKGVGHYKSSAYPTQNDQIVLSGHRDSVFRRVGELEKGDELIIEMVNGTYTYIISDTEIVEADNTDVIRSTAPDEVLTLTTCYPFGYVGNAPKRYIIYALLKEEV